MLIQFRKRESYAWNRAERRYAFAAVCAVILVFASADVMSGDRSIVGEQLMEAVSQGNLTEVERLLNMGADSNTRNECGRTALMESAWAGNTDIAKLLLDKGANIDEKDDVGKTPLIRAVETGYSETARLLLERGADPNVAEADGWTPIRAAVLRSDPDLVKLMVDHGAKKTLQIAAMIGDTSGIRYLITNEADINEIDVLGRTALSNAVAANNPEIVKLLLDNGADANLHISDRVLPLLDAVFNRQIEIVRLLLNHNIDVNKKHPIGWTALSVAVSSEQPEIVEMLLDKGADPSLGHNKYGSPALSDAFRTEQSSVARMLLEKGAEVNSRDKYGLTPLMLALRFADKELVKNLLDKGEAVNAKTVSGRTPLMWAVSRRDVDLVKILLEKGADPNAETDKGSRPLNSAKAGDDNISELLKSVGAVRGKERLFSFCGNSKGFFNSESIGGTLEPANPSTNIRLKSEEVTIRMNKTGYVADCLFHYFNAGAAVSEWIGFADKNGDAKDYVGFDIWVNGCKETVSVKPAADKAGLSNRDLDEIGLKLTFQEHTVTTVRMRYETDYAYYINPSNGNRPTESFLSYKSGRFLDLKDSMCRSAFTVDHKNIGGAKHFEQENTYWKLGQLKGAHSIRYEKNKSDSDKAKNKYFHIDIRFPIHMRDRFGINREFNFLTYGGWPPK